MPYPARRDVLSGLGAALFATTVRARAAGSDLLAPSAMRADVALLRRAYGALHPGLWRYNTPAGINARFATLEAAVARPMSLTAFYLRLSRFLAAVRCGHSYVNPYNQRSGVAAALFDAPDRLPFEFLWLGDRMIVTADPFDIGMARGSEVLAIDGLPVGAILDALMPFARADGHNDAKRRRLLSVQGGERYETFDLFFSALFGRGRYMLSIAGSDGRRRTMDVAAVARPRPAAPENPGAPAWTMERRGAAALLTMPSWGLYDSKWDWRGWLDEQVDRLIADRVPRLVVDLRANEGGLDCGNTLAERLVTAPVPFEDVRRLVRYRTVPDDLRPHLDTWDRSFDQLGETAVRMNDRFLRLDGRGDQVPPVAPRGRRYEGDVRTLIGPQNSSATFQFADFVRRSGIATLMGEPTGGNRRGINGGCFYFLRLPGTNLEVDLPLVGRFPITPQPDAGVRPDVIVPVTQASIASGLDAQLARSIA